MLFWAKQSTAATFIIGPILDSAGAEYASAVIGDLSISKNGGTLTALASAATLTLIGNGQYTLVLTTGNADTLGRAQILCNKVTYQMPALELMVLPATVYDALTTNAVNATGGLVGATGVITGLAGVIATTTNITAGTITTTTNLTNLPAITAGWLTASGIAADAITAAKIADGAIDAATFAAGAITAAAIADNAIDTATFAAGTTIPRVSLADTLTTYTGNTVQTGDSFARIGATGSGLTSLATAAQVSGLAINTRANLQIPIEIENPDASTQVYKIRLHLFDVEGNMEAPDSTPTITLVNAAGTNRASRLSAASNPSTGVYTWDYTATAGDAEEQLVWVFTVVEGALTRTYPSTSYVVEESAYRFSSSDRATLNAGATAAALATAQTDIATTMLWSKRNAVILTGILTGSQTGTEVFVVSAIGITATCTVDSSGNRSAVVWS